MSGKSRSQHSRALAFALALIMTLGMLVTTASAVTLIARPTASTVVVNSEIISFDAYNINDNNYFKLRDLAYVLNGTEKQFSVTWDGDTDSIFLESGKPYIPDGSEMKSKGAGDKTPKPTTSKTYLDGQDVLLTAYNIEDNNYFKLRDIGFSLDFSVEWDGENQTIIIDTSKGYTPEILSEGQWKQIYLSEILAALAYSERMEEDSYARSKYDPSGKFAMYVHEFMLADLNFDGVPELLVFGDAASASYMMRVFTIANGRAEMFFTGWGGEQKLYRKVADGSLAYYLNCFNGDAQSLFGSIYVTDSDTLMDYLIRESAWVADYDEYYDLDDTDAGPSWSISGISYSQDEYNEYFATLMDGYLAVDYVNARLEKWDADAGTAAIQAFLDSYIPEG